MDTSLFSFNQLEYVGPVIILMGTSLVLVVYDILMKVFRGKGRGASQVEGAVITGLGALAALVHTATLWEPLFGKRGGESVTLFTSRGPEIARPGGSQFAWDTGALVIDHFGLFVFGFVAVILLVSALNLVVHSGRLNIYRSEMYPLLVISASGMMLLAISRDLLITFISIEILSLPLYVLCGLDSKRPSSRESSLKYFLLGAFASGFFIYGTALVYGSSGNLNYYAIMNYLRYAMEPSPVLLIGVALVGAGFAFKLAMVPFHAWAPDVYQGAPTPITGFMAIGVKLAVFVAALRFILEGLGKLDPVYWQNSLVLFAVLSMVVGNLLALHQMSAKRLLAFSAIAHTGYLAVGLAAGSTAAAQSMLAYLVAYGLAALGVFMLISYMAPADQDDLYLDEMHNMWQKTPVSAVAMTVLLLSMGGLPLTAGFIGKFLVFKDAWAADLKALVIIALLNSVVSFYYYLRFVIAMYMQPKAPGTAEPTLIKMPAAYIVPGIFIVGLTLLLGVMPQALIDLLKWCKIGG